MTRRSHCRWLRSSNTWTFQLQKQKLFKNKIIKIIIKIIFKIIIKIIIKIIFKIIIKIIEIIIEKIIYFIFVLGKVHLLGGEQSGAPRRISAAEAEAVEAELAEAKWRRIREEKKTIWRTMIRPAESAPIRPSQN